MFRPSLNDSINAIVRYNRSEVIAVDRKAAMLFGGGIGATPAQVKLQLDFLLNDYGGVSRPVPTGCVEEVANAICENADEWHAFLSAAPIFRIGEAFQFMVPTQRLFAAFAPLSDIDAVADTRCASKFLHLLNPKAVAVVDRWVAHALDVELKPGAARANYELFATELVNFGRKLLPDLPVLRAVDEDRSWSDSKLLDKILLCRRACETRLAA